MENEFLCSSMLLIRARQMWNLKRPGNKIPVSKSTTAPGRPDWRKPLDLYYGILQHSTVNLPPDPSCILSTVNPYFRLSFPDISTRSISFNIPTRTKWSRKKKGSLEEKADG